MKICRWTKPETRGSYLQLRFLLMAVLCVALSACAPSLYSVNMKYEPTHAIKPASDQGKFTVTVATFEDHSKVPDPLVVGEVIKSDGEKIRVFPKYVSAQDAVSRGSQGLSQESGISVSPKKPVWDLKNDSIREDWGALLIGGSIEDLSVSCREEIAVKKYQARIKLTIVFADVHNKFVFYKTVAQSSSSLEHVLFSEERLENQVNGVLADAIEKVFEDSEAQRKIREAMRR